MVIKVIETEATVKLVQGLEIFYPQNGGSRIFPELIEASAASGVTYPVKTLF
jgi:hypothetical protein